MKYMVEAVSINRISRKRVSEPRKEEIDTEVNVLFKHCRNAMDVENEYEGFWNELNPNSQEIVKVIGIERVS